MAVDGGGQQQCQLVRVQTVLEGRQLIGEGFNTRAAKLQIAKQLGIEFTRWEEEEEVVE